MSFVIAIWIFLFQFETAKFSIFKLQSLEVSWELTNYCSQIYKNVSITIFNSTEFEKLSMNF